MAQISFVWNSQHHFQHDCTRWTCYRSPNYNISAPVAVVIGAVVVLLSVIWVMIRQEEIINHDGSEL